MEAGLAGCFVRPGTASAQLLLPFDLLWSPQEQRGEGKAQGKKSMSCVLRPGCACIWFTWEVILGTTGEARRAMQEERKPTEGVFMRGRAGHKGDRSYRASSERPELPSNCLNKE